MTALRLSLRLMLWWLIATALYAVPAWAAPVSLSNVGFETRLATGELVAEDIVRYHSERRRRRTEPRDCAEPGAPRSDKIVGCWRSAHSPSQ